ncbi:ribonuclease domain-containing protein [Nonomuraea sp. NPDC050783]|uniref:ribonuclease domain-containing protein n=1 Tax=Nonomuraea sp. NPDC050783 TaxID=3154634 RepID=UPI0034664190
MHVEQRPGLARPVHPVHPVRPVRLAAVRALLAVLGALACLLGLGTALPANADVHGSCTIPRCAAARSAASIWESKDYPTRSGWYPWPDGRHNYTGGRFRNREGQLPAGATYYEYDVYSRARGAARDAYRIVVNRGTGAVWFSPDHYTDFHRL